MPFSILFRNARILASALFFAVVALSLSAVAQSSVSSGTIQGTVTDATKAVVPNAKVEVTNPVSGLSRTVKTDGAGHFVVPNVPFNPYHLVISGPGFATYSQDVDVRSIVPVNLNISLNVKGSEEVVNVEAGGADLVESSPRFIPMSTATCSTSFRWKARPLR